MAKGGKKLQFREVDSYVDSDTLEREILDFWETERIFEKSLAQRQDSELFTFYDGPPYATGKPHYGHILQSAIKDTVLRYKTMRGYYVPRRVGWDTHGLPIENIVEKELGIQEKKEIEADIEGFNKQCREAVFRYVDEFTATLKRIGRWADYDNAYSTLDRDYMESEWWVFRQLWDKDLVYKAFRSTPYCTRCATPLSNFEVSSAYKDKTDEAVYVLLPVVDGLSRKTSPKGSATGLHKQMHLLVWTTTPWTLPANVAVAYSPEVEYVTAEIEGKQILMAKDRVQKVLGEEAQISRTWKPQELEALRYERLYELPSALQITETDRMYGLVAGEHVTAEDGTGLVHMAPAFGEEDAEVGKKYGLPVAKTVDAEGKFIDSADARWAGKHIFDSNEVIMQDLKERGQLFRRQQYTHSYPHCWRCDTPLIYYALDSWFVKVQELKDKLLKNNEAIDWIPEHVKEGRFKKGLEMAPDWAVSRNRYWSVPMPIWECGSCDERVCVGDIAELKRLSGAEEEKLEDIHRPYVDDITWKCAKCEGAMTRIPEVLDVWFDAGSMPYAQWHYPFENTELVDKGFPADFIVEAIEQTRLWFYVLHVLGEAIKGGPAFRNAIGAGLIFAEDGKKLSKKLNNYPDIDPTLATYGADTLRFYLLSSSTLGEPYRFSERDLRKLKQNVYITLWNVYSFFTRYASVHGWSPEEGSVDSEHVLDRWILARTSELERDVMEAMDRYRVDAGARYFVAYIDDLSNWYVRRSRERFQHDASPAVLKEAFSTLHRVLVRVSRLVAPFMPFVSEEIYRNLEQAESVHLAELTDPAGLGEDEKTLLSTMGWVRNVVTEGLALRAREGIKVRQPLPQLVVSGESFSETLVDIVRDEVNVKEIRFGDLPEGVGYAVSEEDANVRVALNTELTLELKAEGAAREVIRYGQSLRRKAGYELNDRISIVLTTDDEELRKMFESQKDVIAEALQADEILLEGEEDEGINVNMGNSDVHIGVRKV